MDITKLAKQIHEDNVAKGFWEDKENRNIGELLMLCVSELSEALEAHRKDRMAKVKGDETYTKEWFDAEVKDTFQDEITDTIIRLLDLSEGLDIPIASHITWKLAYNKERAFKHGKKY